MDKYFIDKKGRAEEYFQGSTETRKVNFPLCLALKYGDDVSAECPNFLLNTRKGKVFVETDPPLAEGSKVLLHFYIPEAKLLSEFKGKVISRKSESQHPKGNLIKIRDLTHRRLQKLEEYLEEKNIWLMRKPELLPSINIPDNISELPGRLRIILLP